MVERIGNGVSGGEGGRDLPFTGATVPIKLGMSANHLNKSLFCCIPTTGQMTDVLEIKKGINILFIINFFYPHSFFNLVFFLLFF